MACTITFTYFDEQANTTDTYVHEFTQDNYDRMIMAYRNMLGITNADTGEFTPSNRNKARKEMSKSSVETWKTKAREYDQIQAAKEAAANVPPIDSTEV